MVSSELFSITETLYRVWVNTGVLSFISRTTTRIKAVPDRGGVPPSTAVMLKATSACCSRSRARSSTSSAYLLPSFRCWVYTWKYSFELIL
uniref:Uncharacterized protein n=1 Tax=Geospiza parvula TaxID=87175 RepID=A0A8C3MAI3_GEOPR